MEKLGAIALSSDILEKANIGLWAFELDEGSEPRMYVNDTMLGLIGLSEQISPEDTYHAWYDHIDPEHYEEVAASVEKMTAGNHAEVQYPWHHPDGSVWVVRCGGVRNFAYKKGIRIEGTHQNVTDIAHFEKEKIEELNTIIEAMSSDYECLLHADFDTDTEEQYRVKESLTEAIPEWKTDRSYSGRIRALADRLVLPEDRDQFLHDADPAVVKEQLKGGVPYRFYYRVKLDGRVQWFQAKYVHNKIHGNQNCALIGVANNDEAMHRSMKERALVEALGEDFSYISYIDPDTGEEVVERHEQKFMDRIPGWYEMSGYEERLRAIGQSFVHPDDRELFFRETNLKKLIRDLMKNPVKYLNFREIFEGETVYYQGKFVLIDIDGVKNVVVGYRSVDNETKRQLSYQEELNKAREKAEEANKVKTSFLFSMSHDIRTPMNAIIGFNNIALSHIDEKEKVIECLQKVNSSSRQLLILINDVLDMSRLESGNISCEYEAMDITEAAGSLLEMVRQTMDKDLQIEKDFSAVEHSFAFADRMHTDRVLMNVLRNSVKYTPEGGTVRFLIKETPSLHEDCYAYDFIIEDNGIGMSEEFLSHIYDAFSREQTSTMSGVQGTGLGMTITKRLVDLLGGTIDIVSEKGKGTRTTIHLEMEKAEPEKTADILPTGLVDFSLLKGKKVLLVEDNELNREIAEDILTEAGILVDTAEDGDVAVEKMKNASAGQVDLVLMDIQMPRMNGYEAARAIRQLPDPVTSSIPIIAMTANAFDEDKKNAMDAGMNGHLAKPVDVQILLDTLVEFLKK